MEIMSALLFLSVCLVLLLGYPVAFSLAGTSLVFALIGIASGTFDPSFLNAFPSRIFGTLTNSTLIAVPLFVFMGVILERSRIA
jgi:TRAP-type mannitol/chloroaromatic compound transport system permease large subunit